MEIEITENKKMPEAPETPQINGIYELREDSPVYPEAKESDAIEILEEGSVVKILDEANDGFVRIEFFGSSAYIKTSKLKEI